MIFCIAFALITALASAAHGGDYLPKIGVMATHALLSLACSLYAPIGVALFWLFFRSGRQARAEMDYMQDKTGIETVRKAYPLYVGYLIAPAIASRKLRREQELIGGFIIGLIIGFTMLIITEL